MLRSHSGFSFGTFALRSAALVGSKAVQDILTSLLFIWLARLNPSGYGLIVLGMSVAMLLRALQGLGLDQYTLRELSNVDSFKGALLQKMARVKFFIVAVVIMIFVAFSFYQQWPLDHIAVVVVLLCGQGLEGLSDTFFNMLRAEGQSINESICRTGPNLVASMYGAYCLLLNQDILFFALMFLLGGMIKLVISIYSARRLCDFKLFRKTSLKLDNTAVFALIAISGVGFLGTFYNEIQIFWLKHYSTLIDVAHYRVAHDVTAFVCGAFSQLVVGAVLFPQFVRTFSGGRDKEFRSIVRSYLRRIICVGSGLAFFLAVFGGSLVSFIYGNQYIGAQPLVPVFGIAAFFSFINNFIIYVLLAMKAEKRLIVFLLLPTVMSVLLGPTIVAAEGILGAACSLFLCRCALTIVLLVALQKTLRILSIMEYRAVLGGWLAALLTYGALSMTFHHLWAGGIALVVYCAFLMMGRRETA